MLTLPEGPPPLDFVMTEFHILLLYPDNVTGISIINEQIVFVDNYNDVSLINQRTSFYEPL